MAKIKAIKEKVNKDGITTFEFQVRIDETHSTRRRGFLSYEEAEISYFNLKSQITSKKYEVKKNGYTYQEIFDDWKKRYENEVRESTYSRTIQIFKNHILPKFGEKYLTQITVDDCQQAVDDWVSHLTKYKIISNYAKKIFKEAVRLDKLDKNPFDKVLIPKTSAYKKKIEQSRNKKNFYSKGELEYFLECAKNTDLNIYTYFRLLAYTGIRRGEALALKWSDIDFSKSTINIFKTLSTDKEGKITVNPTKNGEPRMIVIDDDTLNDLKFYKSIQKQIFEDFDVHVFDDDKQLVFANTKNKEWDSRTTTLWLKRVYKKYPKLNRITTHGFRHTHATLLYEENPEITIKDVQKRLGHLDASITMNIYEHVTDKSDEKILAALKKFDEKTDK